MTIFATSKQSSPADLAELVGKVHRDRAAYTARADALIAGFVRGTLDDPGRAELEALLASGIVAEAALSTKAAVLKNADSQLRNLAMLSKKLAPLQALAKSNSLSDRVQELERQLLQTRAAAAQMQSLTTAVILGTQELQGIINTNPELWPVGTTAAALVAASAKESR